VSMTVAELREASEKFPHYFEWIDGECVPYFDFDKKFDNEDEWYEFCEGEDFQLLRKAMKQVFGKKARVLYSTSHGQTVGGKWKYSVHAVVRGAGKYACGVDIQNAFVEKLDKALEALNCDLRCDTKVYKTAGSRQLMRCIFSMKEDDKKFNRTMIPVNDREKKIASEDLSDEDFALYLANCVEEEPLVEVPKIEAEPRQRTLEDEVLESVDFCGNYVRDGEKKALGIEEIGQLVNGLDKRRIGDYENWVKLIWAIARWQVSRQRSRRMMQLKCLMSFARDARITAASAISRRSTARPSSGRRSRPRPRLER
jgi:hypothetical protein